MVYRLKCISMEDELIGPKIWGAKENTRAYGKSKVLADGCRAGSLDMQLRLASNLATRSFAK